MKKMISKRTKGITLIALVITIIILLILAGSAIATLTGDNSILNKTQSVKLYNSLGVAKDEVNLAYSSAYTNYMRKIHDGVDGLTLTEEFTKEMESVTTGSERAHGATIEYKKANTVETNSISTVKVSIDIEKETYSVIGTLTEDGSNSNFLWGAVSTIKEGTSSVAITKADGTTETITKENVDEYIGGGIKNYKVPGEEEEVAVGANSYKVSTTYRLYYIDFDNKYGDGPGTIYLKADYTSSNNKYILQSEGNIETSKIRNLNPALYKEGVTPPNVNNAGMKKTIWLLDTTKWAGLVESSEDTAIKDYINYVVGAPSIELLMDSYNAHYGLTGDTPDITLKTTATSQRTKLFYKYPDNSNIGYLVGPNYQKKKQFYTYTSDYSFKSDPEADPLYYPPSIGNDTCSYYIASPSSNSKDQPMRVLNNNGGFISYCPSNTTINVFCPIVSVKANCPLELLSN